MMNPLKLFLLILGTASVLAVAPYAISRLVPEPAFSSPARSTRSPVAQVPPKDKAELPVTVSAPALQSASAAEARPPVDTRAPESPTGGQAAGRRGEADETALGLPSPEPPPSRPTPTPSPIPIPYRAEVARAQEMLNRLGFDVGKVDGKLGQRTESALRAFQKQHGITVTGDSDAATLARLQSAIAALATPTPAPPPSPTPTLVKIEPADGSGAGASSRSSDTEPIAIAASASTPPPVSDPGPSPTPRPTPAPTVDPQFVILTPDGKIETPTPAVVAQAISSPTSSSPKENGDDETDEPDTETGRPALELPDLNPDRVPTLRNMKDVRLIQHALYAVGTYAEEPDGKWGKKTIAAMREFQEREGLDVTGKPNSRTWKRLVERAEEMVSARPAPKPASPPATEKGENATATAKSAPSDPDSASAPVSAAAPVVNVPPAPDLPERLLTQVTPGQGRTAVSGTALKEPDRTVAAAGSAPEEQDVVVLPGVDRTGPIVVAEDKLTRPPRAPEPAPESPSAPLPISTPGLPEEPAPAAAPLIASTPDPFAPTLKAEAAQEPKAVAAATDPDPIPTPAEVSRHAVESVANLPEPAGAATDPDETDGSEGQLVPSLSSSGRIIAAPEPVASAAKAPAGLAAAPVLARTTPAAATPDKAAVPATKVTLPPSKEDLREAERVKQLETRVAEIRAAVEAAGADATLDLAKHAPQHLNAARRLLDEAAGKLQGNRTDSAGAEKALKAVEEELQQGRSKSLKAQADDKVAKVEAAYKALKDRFSDTIRRDSQLAETMTKIDGGYEAMKEDFKKGNYEPIVLRCDGFKLAIENLMTSAAKEYVAAELKKKSVQSALKSDVEKEIAALQKKEQYLEAADLLDSALKDKKSDSGSRSRRR